MFGILLGIFMLFIVNALIWGSLGGFIVWQISHANSTRKAGYRRQSSWEIGDGLFHFKRDTTTQRTSGPVKVKSHKNSGKRVGAYTRNKPGQGGRYERRFE